MTSWNLKFSLVFLIKPFCCKAKKLREKLKYFQNERSFWRGIHSIFYRFKGLSAAKNCVRPESAPLTFRFEQLRENSVSLKTINTSESFKSLWSHCIISWLLWQFVYFIVVKSVSVRKKQSEIWHNHFYQSLTLNTKNQICVAATLKENFTLKSFFSRLSSLTWQNYLFRL